MKTIISLILLTTSLMARQAPFYVKGVHDGQGVCTAFKYEEGTGLWMVLPGHIVRNAGPNHTAYVKLRGEWFVGKVHYVADFEDVAFCLVPVSIDNPNIAPLLTSTPSSVLHVGDKDGGFRAGRLVGTDYVQGVVPAFGDSGAPVLTADGQLAGIVIAQTSSMPTSQCFGPNCPNPNFGFQIQMPMMDRTQFVPAPVLRREWGTFCEQPRPYVRQELAAVTLPPFKPGPQGPPGKTVTIKPADPAITVDQIKAIVDERIAEKTEGFITGTEVQRAIDLLKKTPVPVRILRKDNTVYSEDAERKLIDPIEIIAPEG